MASTSLWGLWELAGKGVDRIWFRGGGGRPPIFRLRPQIHKGPPLCTSGGGGRPPLATPLLAGLAFGSYGSLAVLCLSPGVAIQTNKQTNLGLVPGQVAEASIGGSMGGMGGEEVEEEVLGAEVLVPLHRLPVVAQREDLPVVPERQPRIRRRRWGVPASCIQCSVSQKGIYVGWEGGCWGYLL